MNRGVLGSTQTTGEFGNLVDGKIYRCQTKHKAQRKVETAAQAPLAMVHLMFEKHQAKSPHEPGEEPEQLSSSPSSSGFPTSQMERISSEEPRGTPLFSL